MKTEHITYDKFCQLAGQMLQDGEKLSVRAVHSRLGGSFSKLSAYLKQFEQERAYRSVTGQQDISDPLRQAILAEIGKAVSETKAALEAQLHQAGTHLEEANARIQQQETEIAQWQEDLRQLKEAQLLAQKTIEDGKAKGETLQQQLKATQNDKARAETEAAKARLQLERADKDNQELKTRVQDLEARLEKTTAEKFEAEKKAAVAEARWEQAQTPPKGGSR